MSCFLCSRNFYKCGHCRYDICMSTDKVIFSGHRQINCLEMSESKAVYGIYPSQTHRLCIECNKEVTCNISSTCNECMRIYPFHFITPTVAIGSSLSPYDDFDIIVNLNSCSNGTRSGEITLIPFTDKLHIRGGPFDRISKWVNDATKRIVFCGIDDQSNAMSMSDLNRIMELIGDTSGGDKKILFHCAMGISRSATAAIYYLSKTLGITTQEAYEMAKEKRKMICPNKGFQQLLGLNKIDD